MRAGKKAGLPADFLVLSAKAGRQCMIRFGVWSRLYHEFDSLNATTALPLSRSRHAIALAPIYMAVL